MATSGTYAFAPSLGELVIYSFHQCGVRPAALLQEHMESARMATNLMLASWANQGVNLWAVDLITLPLVAGTATYAVDPSTVMILDCYYTTLAGTNDTIVTPISRTQYASYPNKAHAGRPTVFWFDRLISPTITLYAVPDGNQVTLKYYRVRQLQDANLNGMQNVEIPYLWLEAFAQGLSYRLAIPWAPDRAQGLKATADEAYNIAAAQNTENVPIYISPIMSGYYR